MKEVADLPQFLNWLVSSGNYSGIESEQEALIRELEDKNAELERFTYTISHDLKTPLVTIKGFIGFLGNDLDRGDGDAVRRAHTALGQLRRRPDGPRA